MQKQSSRLFHFSYRPYSFLSDLPVFAFIGDNWKLSDSKPSFLHFHNGIEIGHCLEGEGTLYFENSSTISFKTGDYSIIFPEVPHLSVSSFMSSTWEYLYIEPKLLLQNTTDANDKLWQIFYMLQIIPAIIERGQSPLLEFYLSQIFQEFHERKPFYKKVVHGLLVSLLAELNRITISLQTDNTTESEGGYPYIRLALSYINTHFANDITIRELASYCCVSESHFRRLFKNIVGINPLKYIQHYRIQQACQLLQVNQSPINLISRQVGYTSLSSFNREFQKYVHCSPREWQKRILLTPYHHEVHSYEDLDTVTM